MGACLRQPSRHPASCHRGLQLLAAVEVQLCMHFLSRADRLRLARCSRRLLLDARSPHAWLHLPPLSLQCGGSGDVDSLLPPSSFLLPSSLLWAFIPLHIRWSHALDPSDVTRLPLLHRLDVVDPSPGLPWAELLRHPAMGGLEELRVRHSQAGCEEIVAEVPHGLPMLRSLTLWPASRGFDPCLAPLAAAPALTELHCNFHLWLTHVSHSSPPLQFPPSLRRLHLSFGHVSGGAYRSALCCPVAGVAVLGSSLRHLSLRCIHSVPGGEAHMPRAAEFAEVLQSLPHLRSLTLQHVRGVNGLLSVLHRSPSLRELTLLSSGREQVHAQPEAYVPQLPVVRQLHSDAPLLHIRVSHLFAQPNARAWASLLPRVRVDVTLPASLPGEDED